MTVVPSPLFADTNYFEASLLPRDNFHSAAMRALQLLETGQIIITSEMILVEFLNAISKQGAYARTSAINLVQRMRDSDTFIIEPQTPDLFAEAMTLYASRSDKAWSLTDCASICICQRRQIMDVLAYDHHFLQAGLTPLLRAQNG